MAEKWEMSAANTELKNRLQQSMAMSYMQGDNGNMLEEELHKMQVRALEDKILFDLDQRSRSVLVIYNIQIKDH